jgi:putative colanic acid biosynthesis acetyltransferase WcaF
MRAVSDQRQLDVAANRAARKWTRSEQAGRLLWALAHPLFAWSPRPLWGWRRLLLRLFGARIGRAVHIYPSVRIAIPWNLAIGDQAAVGDRAILYALGPITLAERATVSQGAHLCAGTHDHRDPAMPLLKPPIIIGPDAWICADAFVGPGVRVGPRAIVGARCVVMKDVEPDAVMIGNPAKLLRWRAEGDKVAGT